MGAINYGTSEYITIGYNCSNIDYNYKFYNEDINDYYEQVKYTLKQQNFHYFHVELYGGYYEGFYIDIEFNYKWCLDSYEDKKAALKEITRIKTFLLNCINDFECVAVYPGWCTSYEDYNGSIKKINEAIKEMREEVRATPTWARLPKSEKIA